LEKKLVLPLLAALLPPLFGATLAHAGQGGSEIVWPTLKYSFDRAGYVDISRLASKPFHYTDYDILWTFKTGLCVASSAALADLNNDGKLEAVFSSCDGFLYAVDASSGKLVWKRETGGGMHADPTIWDIDGDGKPEIMATGSTGSLYVFSGDGKLLWKHEGSFHGNPVVLHSDTRGSYEVAIGNMKGEIYVFTPDGEIRYRIKVGDLPVYHLAVRDVDGDGLDDIACVEGTYFHIISYKGSKPTVYTLNLGRILAGAPVLYDLYGNGIIEAIIVSRDGHVYVVNPEKGTFVSKKLPGVEDATSTPSVGDVNMDGKPEIVVATMEGLFILDTRLSIVREYPDLQVFLSSPIIADIDGDGENEILVGTYQGDIVAIKPTIPSPDESEFYIYTTSAPVVATASIADVDGDGKPEILVGSRDYNMYCFKGTEETAPQPAQTRTPQQTPAATNTTTTAITQKTNTTRTSRTITSSTTSHATSPAETSTTKTIAMPTGAGKYRPTINYKLVAAGIIAAIIIIAITYQLTRK
jgi:outer membrane protein assembly factor BamB